VCAGYSAKRDRADAVLAPPLRPTEWQSIDLEITEYAGERITGMNTKRVCFTGVTTSRESMRLISILAVAYSSLISSSVYSQQQPPGAQGNPSAQGCCVYEKQPGVKTSREKTFETREACKRLQTEQTMRMVAFLEAKRCDAVSDKEMMRFR
jgi:hypothetical protein